MNPGFFTRFVLITLGILSHIQGWEWVEIDQILEDFRSQNDIPGLVFGFVNGSQSVAKGYGLSDISISKPMDNSTRVFIASISKSFTGIAVCRVLQHKWPELGENVLDIPIVDLVPSYNLTLNDRHRTEHVTFRDLLSHRTCLNINSPVGGGRAKVWKSRQDFIYRLRYLPEQCDFRSTFVYSGNAMLTLAADIAGFIAEVSFDDLVKKLLNDIGMTDSLTTDPSQDYDDGVENISRGYFKNLNGNLERMPISVAVNSIEGPASGGIISTSRDMIKYIQFHLENGLINGTQVVPREVMTWVHKVSNILPFAGDVPISDGDLGYALGLEWGVFQGNTRLGHNGNLPPFMSRMTFYPGLDLGLYTTTNGMATWQMHIPVHKAIMELLTNYTSSTVNFIGRNMDLSTYIDSQPEAKQVDENPFKIAQIRNLADLVGLYGHPYEGDVTISPHEGNQLKLEYGSMGKATLTPINSQPNIFSTLWNPEMSSIFIANNVTNLLTSVNWDFNSPSVLKCIFPGGSLEYRKDATIDTYPVIPWLDDGKEENCSSSGFVAITFTFLPMLGTVLLGYF